MDDYKDEFSYDENSLIRKLFRGKNVISIPDKSIDIEGFIHYFQHNFEEEEELCESDVKHTIITMQLNKEPIEDPSLQQFSQSLRTFRKNIWDKLDLICEELKNKFNTNTLSDQKKELFVAILMRLINNPFRNITLKAMETVRILLQNENGFEEYFLENNIINVYNEMLDDFAETPSSFASLILTISSLVDYNDNAAHAIYELFPYERVFDKALTFFNSKTNELEKDPIGSSLQYATFLLLRNIEISPNDFNLILETLLRNYEIWNEDYFSCFIYAFPSFINKWPIEQIPLDRMEEVGVPGIIAHIFSRCESENECLGEICYIFDGLTLLLKKDYYLKGISGESLWNFLISQDSCLQQSAFNFWINFTEKPHDQWPDILNPDNVLTLINNYVIDFESKIKIIAIDFVSSFVLSLNESDAYSFVFESDTDVYNFLITCVLLTDASIIRLKAINKLVSLFDFIEPSKRKNYVETIFETDQEELEELRNSPNTVIAELAESIIETISSYTIV